MPAPQRDRTLWVLVAIVLFTYTAQNMLNVSVAPLARSLELPEWTVGAAVSAAALTVALLSQFWGRRAVAWGPRRVVLLALLFAFLAGVTFSAAVWARSTGVLGVAATATAIIVARGPFFGATAGAIPPTGQVVIAARTTTEQARVRGLSAFSGAVNASIMVGSVVSSLLGMWWLDAPAHATPWFIAVALGVAWFFFPEVDGAESQSRKVSTDATETKALPPRVAWNDSRLLPWMLGAFGIFFAVGVMQIIAGFIVQDRLGTSPQDAIPLTAAMLMCHAAGAMTMQLIMVPRLGWSPRTLLRRGVTLGFIALLTLTFAGNLAVLIISALALGVSSGLVGPGFHSGGSLAVTSEEQGGAAGVLHATGALTWIFAPVSATALYGWNQLAPFVLAIAVLLISFTVVWTHPHLRSSANTMEN